MIIVSFAILYLDEPEECAAGTGGSYKSAIYFFVVAAAIQLVMSFVVVVNRGDSLIKEGFMKTATLVVAGIYAYLAVYFFLFKGCQDLIKYWVLGNVLIIIVLVGLRIAYIVAKEGKQGLYDLVLKRNLNQSASLELPESNV
jgi:hypothetical protein